MTDDVPELNLAREYETRIRVPNEFPTIDKDLGYKIAFIGEAPGADEETLERPFVGASGFLLDNCMANVGIVRSACLMANLCQIKPPGNELKRFKWNGDEIQSGLRELSKDLRKFDPNICVLLGQYPLFAALGGGYDIADYRGSLFQCDEELSPFYGYKCVGTYHPANCLPHRSPENTPLLKLDLARAKQQGADKELHLPQRKINIELSAHEIYNLLRSWPDWLQCSADIEGTGQYWSMIGLSSEPMVGYIIPWKKFSETEHIMVLCELARFLKNPRIPKVFQQGLYDSFILGYFYKLFVSNISEDTMLKGWEVYCELPKGLDTQASIWTLQPQWKHLIAYSKKERKKRADAGVDPIQEYQNKQIACGIDCSVTLEISLAQDRTLDSGKPGPDSKRHYRFNTSLLTPLRFMMHRGMAYDSAAAAEMRQECSVIRAEAQSRLDTRVGFPINMNSPQQVANYLYVKKGFEKQFKKEHGRNTERVTTNVGALLTLVRKYDSPILHDMLLIRRLAKRIQSLSITTDPDGRIRCGYNIVGTETGRLSCYTSDTGSGENLQTVTKKHRRLYTADPGKYFFQCDLEGADGWTVAAHCAAHGDSTMLEDYYFGIKPARVIALMYEHGIEIGKLGRPELKERGLTIDGDGWLYFGSKRIQHGTNYELGPVTMSDQILTDSYKYLDSAIWVPPPACKRLQELYVYGRYGGINGWKQWARDIILSKTPGGLRLTSASGHTRIFFGRRRDGKSVCHSTLREFLAHEPQANTTYATNFALRNLWDDMANRVSSYFGVGSSVFVDRLVSIVPDGMDVVNEAAARLATRTPYLESGLLIENLHQVHDALNGQFDKRLLPWAKGRINTYFNNPMTIAGINITIPYDGGYGPNWGECGVKRDKKTGEILSQATERGQL